MLKKSIKIYSIVLTLIVVVMALFLFKKQSIETIVIKKQIDNYKDYVKEVKDTIYKTEIRLQKAKEIHDTITILKEQDTLIKELKVVVKVQDTIILKQDSIINTCEKEIKVEKRKRRLAYITSGIITLGAVILKFR